MILSLVLGLFGQSAPPAPAPVAPPPPVVLAPLSKPAVSIEDAARARAAVKHEETPGGNGTRKHHFEFPDGTVVEFTDRLKAGRDSARREHVIGFTGTEAASREPDSTFDAAGHTAGLSPEAIAALRFISRHEGGFDAINTWDSARFSWGFIQFAGGYGLRPVMAHFKQASPDLFQKLLADYGIDVLPVEGSTERLGRSLALAALTGQNAQPAREVPEPVFLDTTAASVVRGAAAEQAYGDNPLVIALFIRAGRVTEVKQRQVEAAIRDYAAPALTATREGFRLSEVLRSPQGLASLIDRQVHEGNIGRLDGAVMHVRLTYGLNTPEDCARREGEILDLAVRDADARATIAELINGALPALERAAAAARNGDAALVPEGPSLTMAREALDRALTEADYRMVAGTRRSLMHDGFTEALVITAPERLRLLSAADLADRMDQVSARSRELVAGLRAEAGIRNRLRDIRTSNLPGPVGE